MAILNYTTSVDAKKTVAEIQEKLSKAGCKRIIIDYDDEQNPASVSFSVNWNNNLVFFQLPCNHKSVLNAMIKSKDVRSGLCTDAQAYRVSWRIIKDWIEAQLAIVEAEQATIQQVFLPYAMTKGGQTLYNQLQEDNSQLLIG
jgi:hypothetical protein